jgi:hypothetical protein
MQTKIEYVKINWSPFATNILDAHEYDLCMPDGTPVEFHRSNGGFVLVLDDARLETDDNLQMSYWMNQREIGGLKRHLTQRAADEPYVDPDAWTFCQHGERPENCAICEAARR